MRDERNRKSRTYTLSEGSKVKALKPPMIRFFFCKCQLNLIELVVVYMYRLDIFYYS